MALEITTNDLPVTPDKQVYYTGCCVITHALWKKAGDMHVLHSSTHPLNGFIKAYIYIYIHIFCAINILDYYRTLYYYITQMYNLIVISQKTFRQAAPVNMDTVKCLWRRTNLIVYT